MATLYNSDAELATLGCILLDPGAALPVAKAIGLTASLFYDLRHRAIFNVCWRMFDAGEHIDVITLSARLSREPSCKGIDGQYLGEIQDLAPSAANLPFYLPDLKRAFTSRQLLSLGQIITESAENSNIADALDSVEAAVQAIRENAGASDLPPITDAAALIADKTPEPPQLVHGLLHRGSKLALGGMSKGCKTWTLIDLGVSVASGEPFLSFHTAKGRVLFLNFEVQPEFFARRLEYVAKAKGVTLAPGAMDVWNLRGHSAGASAVLPKIRRRARHGGYALVILDPLYKLLGEADENSARDMAALMNEVERLTADTGAAIAFGAHFSKGQQAGKRSVDRISGSGVFARDPDTLLIFTEHETQEAFTVEATVRNFKPIEPFAARWLFPLMRRDDDLDPARLKQGNAKRYSPEQLVDVLEEGETGTSAWQKKASAEIGISSRQFYNLLDQVRDSGLVKQNRKRQWVKAKLLQ